MPSLVVPDLYPNFGDAYAQGTGTAYPPSFTSGVLGAISMPLRRSKIGADYYVSNVLLRFDTSGLPDDATLESAVLRIYYYDYRKDADKRGIAADWYDMGAANPDSGDYSSAALTTALVSYAFTSLRPAAAAPTGTIYYADIPLANVTGVSKTGVTGIRLHVTGGQPAGENFISVLSKAAVRQGRSYGPLLKVNYATSAQTPRDQGGAQPSAGSSTGTDTGGPGAQPQPVASSALPRTSVEWRVMLCDRQGLPISTLTQIATSKTLSYRLNRPARLSFVVPSDDPAVATVHTDGYPRLEVLRRTVKAYRREVLADGSLGWKLRFTGIVWQLQDSGDPDHASTAVTCFDPIQLLSRRYTGDAVTFTNIDGGSILRQLVDATNATDPTGIDLGVVEQTPVRTRKYDRTNIGTALVELASAFNGFDVILTPVDQQDGTLGILNVYSRAGRLQPNLVFGWQIAPHNVQSVQRLVDGETVANVILARGGQNVRSEASDQESTGELGRLEASEAWTDITNQALVDALVTEALAFRRAPRELVAITPFPGRAPEPFTHVNLGDLFYVYAGARLRGGIAGVQRCYGFDLTLSEEAVETVAQFVVAPEAS